MGEGGGLVVGTILADGCEGIRGETVNVIAWLSIVFSAVAIIGGPFGIGKPRDPLTAGGYVCVIVQAVVMTMLSGRVLGWW